MTKRKPKKPRESREPKNTVYAIRNLVTGQVYIGQTVNWYYRKAHHRSNLKTRIHQNPHLQASFDLYGAGAFKYEVLETISDVAFLEAYEQSYLSYYRSLPAGVFNVKDEYRHAEETKQRMRKPKSCYRGLPVKGPPYSKGKSYQRKGRRTKPIDQICLETGLVLREWESATQADREGFSRSALYEAFKKGGEYRGFGWVQVVQNRTLF